MRRAGGGGGMIRELPFDPVSSKNTYKKCQTQTHAYLLIRVGYPKCSALGRFLLLIDGWEMIG